MSNDAILGRTIHEINIDNAKAYEKVQQRKKIEKEEDTDESFLTVTIYEREL